MLVQTQLNLNQNLRNSAGCYELAFVRSWTTAFSYQSHPAEYFSKGTDMVKIPRVENKSLKEREVWKIIEEFSDYSISNCGNISRIKDRGNYKIGKILKPLVGKTGYLSVCLYSFKDIKRVYVHKLVAQYFIGDCFDGYQVNHKDGDKSNNKICNLEYVTAKTNTRHAIDLGLHNNRGSNNGSAKLTELKVKEIKRLYLMKKYKQQKLAKYYRVSQSVISNICSGITWRHL